MYNCGSVFKKIKNSVGFFFDSFYFVFKPALFFTNYVLKMTFKIFIIMIRFSLCVLCVLEIPRFPAQCRILTFKFKFSGYEMR